MTARIIDLRDPCEEAKYRRLSRLMVELKQPGMAGAFVTVASYLPPANLARLPRQAFIDEANRHEVVRVPVLDPEGNPMFTVRGKPRTKIDRLPDGSPRLRLVHRFDEEGGECLGGLHQRAHSWTRNAYNLPTSQLCVISAAEGATFGAGGMYNKDTGGNNRYSAGGCHYINANSAWAGGLGTATQGIVVGTGTGAESFEDYALGARVAHGTGAGQLSYAAQDAAVGNYTSGTKIWGSTMFRYMNNNSGGAIVVGEVGIYVYTYYHTSTAGYFMLARDLLDPTVNVADTAQLKVTYTITSMAYPA